MTNRFWFLGVVIYFLVFLGLASLEGGLILLAFPLLAYLGMALYFAPASLDLTVTRTISTDNVPEGKPVTMKVTILNRGNSLEEVLLEDLVSDKLTLVDGKTRKRLAVPAGKTVELEYTVRGSRGKYRFVGIRATATDLFGIFQRQKIIPAPASILVFPKMAQLRQIHIHPRQTRGFAGPILARRGGSGVDFFGVREYQIGDSPRRINWRISSRHEQEFFSNEFEQEAIADVGLILDSRQQTNLVDNNASLFEYSVLATASIADAVLQEGHRVSLLVYGFGMERVFPGYGKVQKKRLMRTLAQAETGDNYALESLVYLPTRLFSARSQIILISPLGNSDLGPLLRLRALGYEVLAVCPNPLDFAVKLQMQHRKERSSRRGVSAQGENSDSIDTNSPVLRLAQIERALLFGSLRRAGIQIVDWKVDQPLSSALHSVIAQPTHGRLMMGVSQ
jgi:uncharacterized protein (DUF58 family)